MCVVILFDAGGAKFALKRPAVSRILPLPRLSRPPASPSALAGFFALGPDIVTVLSFETLIGKVERPAPGLYNQLVLLKFEGPLVALVVDRDLSAKHADLAQRAAEFHTRANVAENLAPLAKRRESESKAVLAEYESLAGDGLSTAARRESALRAHYDAREARVQFSAESQTLAHEIPAIEEAQADAANALEDLALQYGNGEIRAPKGGAIGASVPSAGAVYLPGDPMLTIYSGDAYSLVYLPTRYLLPVREGMRVAVSNGRQKAHGVIDEILPVSDALPAEFQNTFRPQDRSQLARIRFDSAPPFPVGEKIRVSLNYFGSRLPKDVAAPRLALAEPGPVRD